MKGEGTMSDDYILDDVLPDKKGRHSRLMDQLKELDNEQDQSSSSTFVVSATPDWLPKQPSESNEPYTYKNGKKKKSKHIMSSESTEPESDDDWMQHLLELDAVKVSGKRRRKDFILNEDGEIEKKKRGKKKKKDGEPTDFVKEFSPEMALYRGLLRDQSALVDSLQKQYNGMISTKGSSRGITKVTTDLIANISSARNTAMQLIDKTVALKKACYDLAAKEKKEMSGLGDGENMADYAGAYLKQIINQRDEIRNLSDYDITETDVRSMGSILDEASADLVQDEDVERYLKYEGRKPKIYAVVNPNDSEDYYFMAVDTDGIEIMDYPLPPMTKLSINRSTEIATDEYGQKYHIQWKTDF